MFDTINEVIRDFTSGMSSTGKILLGAGAIIFIVVTGFIAMKAFSKGDVGKGFLFVGLSLAVLIVSLVVFGAIKGIGKGTGKDMNNKYSLMPIIPFISLAFARFQMKRQQRKEIKQLQLQSE